MRGCIFVVIAALAFGCGLSAQEQAAKSVGQIKAARENWALLEADEPVSHETDHFIVLAPKSMERRIKEIGGNLEKAFALAVKSVQAKPKEDLWPGKLIVYLLPEREQFTTFIRRVEKRRLSEEEAGSHFVDGDVAHAAASSPRTKTDPSLEHQAAAQVAAALLQKKTGPKVIVPEWLLLGFGRATAWRAAPADKVVINERRVVKALVAGKKRTAGEVWGGTLEPDEAVPLRASLAEFLAYGPGATKFPALLNGFKPGENQDSRTTEQALESANLDPKAIEARWGPWAVSSTK